MPSLTKSLPHESVKIRTEKLDYVWEVEDLMRLRRLAKMEVLPVDGAKLRTQTFGSHTTGYWYLELLPGKSDADDESTQIFLCLDTSKTEEAMAEFAFFLLEGDGKKIEGFKKGSKEFQLFKAESDEGTCHGCEIDASALHGLTRDGNLMIRCEIVVFLGIEFPVSGSPPTYDSKTILNGYYDDLMVTQLPPNDVRRKNTMIGTTTLGSKSLPHVLGLSSTGIPPTVTMQTHYSTAQPYYPPVQHPSQTMFSSASRFPVTQIPLQQTQLALPTYSSLSRPITPIARHQKRVAFVPAVPASCAMPYQINWR